MRTRRAGCCSRPDFSGAEYQRDVACISIPVLRIIQGKASVELNENQIAQIRSAAVCELKGSLKNGQATISNPAALVQLYQLLRESPAHQGARDPLRRIEETGENLVSYVDGLGSVRDAVEFYSNTSIRFFDGEPQSRGMRGIFGNRATRSNRTRRPTG